MANRVPLQPGDIAPDYSTYSSSPEADRRPQEVTPARTAVSRAHGAFQSNDQDRAREGQLWKAGQAVPNEFLSAPFPVISMDGDNNGQPAEVHEIDIYSYGDGYDPTSPMRVRTVDNYTLDSDMDGHLN